MYRGHSPLFDVPEHLAARHIKPMPKRRRTSDSAYSEADPLQRPRETPGPSATHPDFSAINSQYNDPASQTSYYMPILNGIQDMFKSEQASRSLFGHMDFTTSFHDGATRTDDDDDQGEGDYIDHLQQPGNTKKRKVPSAAHQLHGSPSEPPSLGTGDDEPPERDRGAMSRLDLDGTEGMVAVSALSPGGTRRKRKVSYVTLAGLQRKEILKARRSQLAEVLGDITPNDTLALDQALAAHYPSAPNTLLGPPVLSENLALKPSRRWDRGRIWAEPSVQGTAFPTAPFTFVSPSISAERFAASRSEAAALHARFEDEFARQAAKAAEAAKESALATPESAKRAVQRARPSAVAHSDVGSNVPADQSPPGTKARQTKKKKRSALANASNPHHLRNYVPSRLPHSGQPPPQSAQATLNAQNHLGPPPARFLSTEVPPRRRRKATTPAAPTPLIAPLTTPAEEWICPFCEYDLFYGGARFRRAVRNRRKILKRRRRARLRAAAAASGVAPAVPPAVAPAEKAMAAEGRISSDVTAGDPSSGRGLMTKRDRDKNGS